MTLVVKLVATNVFLFPHTTIDLPFILEMIKRSFQIAPPKAFEHHLSHTWIEGLSIYFKAMILTPFEPHDGAMKVIKTHVFLEGLRKTSVQ
jgi:hypothetical protein